MVHFGWPQFRADSSCPFTLWSHYKKSLTLPAPAVLEIDKTTDKILDMLSCPSRPGNWYRAGLVVGHVQSGKTGNFVGLANKAMDVGYKIILVLTGMYNDLRSQNARAYWQRSHWPNNGPRWPELQKTIGVGKYEHHPNILNLTSSKLKGDFGSEKTDIGGVLTSQDPTIIGLQEEYIHILPTSSVCFPSMVWLPMMDYPSFPTYRCSSLMMRPTALQSTQSTISRNSQR